MDGIGSTEMLHIFLSNRPGRVRYGISGLSYQVGATLLGSKLGGRFRHVNYKSFPQIFNDLVVGVLDVALVDTTPVVPLSSESKLRVLATASKEREAKLSNIPTVREAGIDFDFAVWTALAVLAGTPGDNGRKLEAELRKALTSQGLRDFVDKLGVSQLWSVSGREIDAEVAAGLARFKESVAEIATEMGGEKR